MLRISINQEILVRLAVELMNEAEYLMKNYGDRGACYPSRP